MAAMKRLLQRCARACILVVLVLGMSPFDASAEHRVALQDAKNVVSGAEPCCGPETPGWHAAECLILCSASGQMMLPTSIELAVASTQNPRPEPEIGSDDLFPDLEPDPPRPFSRTI
jgi:hypothetical protein